MLSHEAEIPAAPARADTGKRVVVIGFGSPIRGDDAFGPLVADELGDLVSDARVDIQSRHILTAEQAESLRDASLIIFIDASVDGEIGEVVQRRIEPRRDTSEAIAHSVDAPGLLAWTEGLYGYAPPAILLSTRAATFDYANYQLSPAVAATVPVIIGKVEELIESHLERHAAE